MKAGVRVNDTNTNTTILLRMKMLLQLFIRPRSSFLNSSLRPLSILLPRLINFSSYIIFFASGRKVYPLRYKMNYASTMSTVRHRKVCFSPVSLDKRPFGLSNFGISSIILFFLVFVIDIREKNSSNVTTTAKNLWKDRNFGLRVD